MNVHIGVTGNLIYRACTSIHGGGRRAGGEFLNIEGDCHDKFSPPKNLPPPPPGRKMPVKSGPPQTKSVPPPRLGWGRVRHE